MAESISGIAQALAIACLNQEFFIKDLIVVSNVNKPPTVAKDAKLLGETVAEFYQAVYKGVEAIFTKS